MTKAKRALRMVRLMREHELSVRYRRERIGKRVKWYAYTLGREGPVCRSPEAAVEQYAATREGK